VSDHQQPHDGTFGVAESVLELVQGVDLLIHDAQYSPQEFALRRDWGHCTVEYAVEVALRADVAKLALYHHDPSHSDEVLDGLLALAFRRAQGRSTLQIVAASEGLTLTV
jgi:ribonuclease BN (tRNA processing enzyme)